MSNILTLIVVACILGISTLIGSGMESDRPIREKKNTTCTVPDVGRIEILNGCGVEGAAGKLRTSYAPEISTLRVLLMPMAGSIHLQ